MQSVRLSLPFFTAAVSLICWASSATRTALADAFLNLPRFFAIFCYVVVIVFVFLMFPHWSNAMNVSTKFVYSQRVKLIRSEVHPNEKIVPEKLNDIVVLLRRQVPAS